MDGNILNKEIQRLVPREAEENNLEENFVHSSFSNDSLTNISLRLDDARNNNIRFLLTNARSLSPKILSLVHCFDEFKLHISVVTESWLADGDRLGENLESLEYGTDLKVIYKNRPVRANCRRSTAGGGVAIIFNKTTCNLKELRVKKNKYELVCAKGRIGDDPRIVIVIGVYLEPKLLVSSVTEINELISDIMLREKSANPDPIFIIGGDMNKKNIHGAFDDFIDVHEVNHGPTRLTEKLDLTFVNVPGTLAEICAPLETEIGTKSDHACVLNVIPRPELRRFVWKKVRVRKRSNKGDLLFGKLLLEMNWEYFYRGLENTTQMTIKLHRQLNDWMDQCYPMVTLRRRTNEDPWITNGIRKKIRMRNAIYRREGRSRRWRRLDKHIKALIKQKKKEFVQLSKKDCRSFFRSVKQLNTKDRPKPWAVSDLYLGKEDMEVAEIVTEYFGDIADLLPPLDPGLKPRDCGMETCPALSGLSVANRIKMAKKPSSMVEGDIYPHIYGLYDLSRAVEPIYNKILETRQWPEPWKVETITVIPKTQNPSSLSECRNISCTNFLSKVMETIILEQLRSQIESDKVQFGGIKGTGVEHLLVEIWDRVLGGLEVPEVAVALLGIDYQKAFNRMCHNECLVQLAKHGASQSSIDLVGSFLDHRSMQTKVGQTTSSRRPISRAAHKAQSWAAIYIALPRSSCRAI